MVYSLETDELNLERNRHEKLLEVFRSLPNHCEKAEHYLERDKCDLFGEGWCAALGNRPDVPCIEPGCGYLISNRRKKMAQFSLVWQSLWNTKQKRQLGLCTEVLGWLAIAWGFRWHSTSAAVLVVLMLD